MKKIGLIISLLIFSISCAQQDYENLPDHVKQLENVTVYDSVPEPSGQIQIQREQTFGSTEDEFIGRLSDVAIDNSGRVYIADSQEFNINVFNPDGQFLTTIGRRGQGPGEFQELSDLQIVDNRLFVFDRNRQMVQIFSTDSQSYLSGITVAENRNSFDDVRDAFLNKLYVRSDSTFLNVFSKSRMPENVTDWEKFGGQQLFYSINESGDIMGDKLLQRRTTYQVLVPFPGRRSGMPFEMYGKPLTTLSDEDYIFDAWSEDFLIKVYSPDGAYERAFYYPFERASLEPESAFNDAAPAFIAQAVQFMDFPETWPALNDLLADDEGRLWVSTIVEDVDIYEWWVLEENGDLIATFEWPRDEPIQTVKNSYIYTVETDNETELQQVVRYRIENK